MRGFYTGLAAALAFFALASLWLMASSWSYRDVSDLSSLQALRVDARTQDARSFLSNALADAQSDAAFAVHGCAPASSYVAEATARVRDYINQSALRLSDGSVKVAAEVTAIAFPVQALAPGFDTAYGVNVSVRMNLDGGTVKAARNFTVFSRVDVNSSNSFRVLVNRTTGPLREVRVDCP